MSPRGSRRNCLSKRLEALALTWIAILRASTGLRLNDKDDAASDGRSVTEDERALLHGAAEQQPFLPNVGIYSGAGAWRDTTMVDNYNMLMDHYKGIHKTVRNKNSRRHHVGKKADTGDDEEEEGEDYGRQRLQVHSLHQLTDSDYEEAGDGQNDEEESSEGERDEDEDDEESEAEGEEDEDDTDSEEEKEQAVMKERMEAENEYDKRLQRRVEHVGKGDSEDVAKEKRSCKECWEAVKSHYSASQCSGYEQVGFICLQDQCAACEPTGPGSRIEECATRGPAGSAPDAFTGRCLADSSPAAAAAAGVQNSSTALLQASGRQVASQGAQGTAYDSSYDYEGEHNDAKPKHRRSPEEECHYGLEDFQRRWVDAKKEYCCKHFQLGCLVEHARALDPASAHSLQETGSHDASATGVQGKASGMTSSSDSDDDSSSGTSLMEDTNGVPPVLVEMFKR